MASPLSSALGERLHHNIDAGFSGRAAAVRLGIQLRLDQAVIPPEIKGLQK